MSKHSGSSADESDAALVSTPALWEPPTVGEHQLVAEVEAKALHTLGRADTAIDAGAIGSLTLRAASVRGAFPRYYGETRQDEYCFALDETGARLVVAVADGVSSGDRSHLAAGIAVRQACTRITTALAETSPATLDWKRLYELISWDIVEAAQRQDPALEPDQVIKIMATTLSVLVVDAEEHDDRSVVAASLGDCSCWVLHEGRLRRKLGGKPEGGEVESSAVEALPGPPTSLEVTEFVLLAGAAVILVSDGIGDALGDGTSDVGREIARWWSKPPMPLEFAGPTR